MRNTANAFKTLITFFVLLGTLLVGSIATAEEAKTVLQKGKEVSFDRKKGNCLACHAMDDGTLPGNIGPPLVSMKLRFPDKAKLREQIWDSTTRNPNTIMPPFGRHGMLTEEEIDWITEYVYSL
jgi:sulfur-oxidizing protein SoxX